jgi:hypothetical protein
VLGRTVRFIDIATHQMVESKLFVDFGSYLSIGEGGIGKV